jgi:hypothetical protein
MKKKNTKKTKKPQKKLPGYKPYLESDDIYTRLKEERINPEELQSGAVRGKVKNGNIKIDPIPEAFELDVPGSELDDDIEAIGSEDEENNYYSLGGDDHDDLEEDRGY